jgi:hypothetical protein
MPKKSLEERALMEVISYVPDAKTLDPGPSPKPSTPKAAVRRCCAAWQRAFKAHMDQSSGDSVEEIFAASAAGEAYRNAMPMLSGHEGVRDFIACAAQGILIGAIPREQSSHLLYAAQIALATVHRESKPPKSPSE